MLRKKKAVMANIEKYSFALRYFTYNEIASLDFPGLGEVLDVGFYYCTT